MEWRVEGRPGDFGKQTDDFMGFDRRNCDFMGFDRRNGGFMGFDRRHGCFMGFDGFDRRNCDFMGIPRLGRELLVGPWKQSQWSGCELLSEPGGRDSWSAVLHVAQSDGDGRRCAPAYGSRDAGDAFYYGRRRSWCCPPLRPVLQLLGATKELGWEFRNPWFYRPFAADTGFVELYALRQSLLEPHAWYFSEERALASLLLPRKPWETNCFLRAPKSFFEGQMAVAGHLGHCRPPGQVHKPGRCWAKNRCPDCRA